MYLMNKRIFLYKYNLVCKWVKKERFWQLLFRIWIKQSTQLSRKFKYNLSPSKSCLKKTSPQTSQQNIWNQSKVAVLNLQAHCQRDFLCPKCLGNKIKNFHSAQAASVRYSWRFFDRAAYAILSATLATDQKWPLSHLRISY